MVDPEGNPVEGATVAPAKTGSGNSLTGDTRYSYSTDEQGKFTMLLPASRHTKYNLIAHDGEYNQWRNWAGGVTRPFQTQPGQVIHDLEIQLQRGATVRGRVLDAASRPKPFNCFGDPVGLHWFGPSEHIIRCLPRNCSHASKLRVTTDAPQRAA